MRQTAEWLLAQFPELQMRIEAVLAEGDTVAARGLLEGTNLAAEWRGAPTGKRFVARQRHWFRVENDTLAEPEATREDLLAMPQLGVVQRPGRPPSWRAA